MPSVVGLILIVAGLWFAVRGTGGGAAEGSARSLMIRGPAWLILVGIGAAMIVWATWHTDRIVRPDEPQDKLPVTEIDTGQLDSLLDRCAAGDFAACDDLYVISPAGSDWERFGATCGGIFAVPIDEWCSG